MDCVHSEELMQALLDGDISEEQKKELFEHLDGCEECAAKLRAYEKQAELLRSLLPECAPVDMAVLEERRGRRVARKRNRLRTWLSASVAVLVIGVCSVLVFTHLNGADSKTTAAGLDARRAPVMEEAAKGNEIGYAVNGAYEESAEESAELPAPEPEAEEIAFDEAEEMPAPAEIAEIAFEMPAEDAGSIGISGEIVVRSKAVSDRLKEYFSDRGYSVTDEGNAFTVSVTDENAEDIAAALGREGINYKELKAGELVITY